jgi:hypothetical protein
MMSFFQGRYDASVRPFAKFLVVGALATLVVIALVWLVIHDTASEPYSVTARDLSGWTIVQGQPDDPWVVAAQPPESLVTSLSRQLAAKVRQGLVAPPHVALPLVMRTEYSEALQGVYDVDSILRMARDGGLPTAKFEPVCVGHRVDSHGDRSGEFFFVSFNALEFWQLRRDLQPDFPEHAGTGIFDPGALSPTLPLAATDARFDRWWPVLLDQPIDCQAQLVVR